MALRSLLALAGLLLTSAFSPIGVASAWAQAPSPGDALATYVSPSGASFRADARLVPGLDVLRQLDDGRGLLDALGQGGVTVTLAAEPARVWAHYDTDARQIVIDQSLAGRDPRTLAALLSHEAVHVRNTQGTRGQSPTRASGGGCYAEEVAAMQTELTVWQQLFGPGGKAPADHAYEREENTALSRYLSAPDRYWDQVAASYARVCGS
ncbi:MAG TPA: hypothetical protein VFE37_01225 [Chloroflexota bacterium]|nr:hypothetical protein [Chloroflexota bacterium]